MSPEPTPDRTTSGHDADATGRQRFGLVLAVALGLIATGFSYWGTRDTWVAADRRSEVTPVALSGAEADPASDIELPQGPHREEFQTSCLICHSARLPLGQPPFGRDKWAEVVHKMVAAYGAPLTPQEEGEVVDYLLVARPPGP
jgi:mono/diheme cytochrome c family protein